MCEELEIGIRKKESHKKFNLILQWNLIKIDFSGEHEQHRRAPPPPPPLDAFMIRFLIDIESPRAKEKVFIFFRCFVSLLNSEWYRVFISYGTNDVSIHTPRIGENFVLNYNQNKIWSFCFCKLILFAILAWKSFADPWYKNLFSKESFMIKPD